MPFPIWQKLLRLLLCTAFASATVAALAEEPFGERLWDRPEFLTVDPPPLTFAADDDSAARSELFASAAPVWTELTPVIWRELEPAAWSQQAPQNSPDGYPRWDLRPGDIFPLFWGDPSLAGFAPASDDAPSYGLIWFLGYDSFRGIPDGSWTNNGIHTGFNLGTRLGKFSDWSGIGAQVGASVGAYDWAGTDYRLQNQNKAESQGFFTYGLFRKPTADSSWSAAVVQDWMFNDTFSVFAENPTLSQLRIQLGYAISASNEFGVWGAVRLLDDTRELETIHWGRYYDDITWRPVSQLSAYWHHKWSLGGPNTWISVGVPEMDRLSGGGSLGDYLVSANAVCPLSNAMAIYSGVMYMHQSASPGPAGANDEAWNFAVGVAVYPRRNARSTTVSGQRWMPQLPVANNGTFLVDASNWY